MMHEQLLCVHVNKHLCGRESIYQITFTSSLNSSVALDVRNYFFATYLIEQKEVIVIIAVTPTAYESP